MKKVMVFLMVCIFSTMVFSQRRGEEGVGLPGHFRKEHRKGARRFERANFWFKEDVLIEAGVPENLRIKIRSTMHDARKKMFDIGFKVREINIKMREDFFKENINWKMLRKLNKQSAELKRNQILIMGNAKIDILKMLSKIQRKKLLDIVKNRRNNFMKRMFRRQHR